MLFPPHVDKNVAKGKDVIRQGEDDEPVRFVAQTQMNLSHLSSTLLYIYHRQFLVDNCRRGTWRKCNRRQYAVSLLQCASKKLMHALAIGLGCLEVVEGGFVGVQG